MLTEQQKQRNMLNNESVDVVRPDYIAFALSICAENLDRYTMIESVVIEAFLGEIGLLALKEEENDRIKLEKLIVDPVDDENRREQLELLTAQMWLKRYQQEAELHEQLVNKLKQSLNN